MSTNGDTRQYWRQILFIIMGIFMPGASVCVGVEQVVSNIVIQWDVCSGNIVEASTTGVTRVKVMMWNVGKEDVLLRVWPEELCQVASVSSESSSDSESMSRWCRMQPGRMTKLLLLPPEGRTLDMAQKGYEEEVTIDHRRWGNTNVVAHIRVNLSVANARGESQYHAVARMDVHLRHGNQRGTRGVVP